MLLFKIKLKETDAYTLTFLYSLFIHTFLGLSKKRPKKSIIFIFSIYHTPLYSESMLKIVVCRIVAYFENEIPTRI